MGQLSLSLFRFARTGGTFERAHIYTYSPGGWGVGIIIPVEEGTCELVYFLAKLKRHLASSIMRPYAARALAHRRILAYTGYTRAAAAASRIFHFSIDPTLQAQLLLLRSPPRPPHIGFFKNVESERERRASI